MRPAVNDLLAEGIEVPGSGSIAPDNAYLAVLGFTAPEGISPVTAGRRAHLAYQEAVQDDPSGKTSELAEVIGAPPAYSDPFELPQCDPLGPDCLEFYRRNREQHSRHMEENSLILDRYADLGRYAYYQDLMSLNPWDEWTGLSSAIYTGHVLTAAEAAGLIDDGSGEEGIALLADDIVLWRKLLAGSDFSA